MYYFSDPHPGLMGCPKRLHRDIKLVVHDMSDESMLLETALCRIEDAIEETGEEGMKLTIHHADDEKRAGWIMLDQRAPGCPYHCWRLIRYSEKQNGNETDS